jgi:hypothetical protein
MAVVKAVQSGAVSFTAADSTKTATITAITTAKSILFFTYSGNTSSNPNDELARGTITNTTTLTFTRFAASNTLQVEWFLVEFSSGVTAQQGYQASVSTTTNITVTSVNTAKSWSQISFDADSYSFDDDIPVSQYLSSSTNLSLQRSGSTTPVDANWQVIEYDNASVQYSAKSLAVGSTSTTLTITAVTTAKTFLQFDFRATSSTAATDPQYFWNAKLSNTTTITFDRNTSGIAHSGTVYAISISDTIDVQRGEKSFAGGDTSLTSAITAVVLARSHVQTINCKGFVFNSDDSTGGAMTNKAGIKTKFNSTTQLSFVRNTSGQTAKASWETIQWASASRVPDFAPFIFQVAGVHP